MKKRAEECANKCNARAKLLFCLLNLLFFDVLVAVRVVGSYIKSLLSRLDRVDPVGTGKVFMRRKVGLARRVTLRSKKGDHNPPSGANLFLV